LVANTTEVLPGDFTRNVSLSPPVEGVKRALTATVGKENSHFVDAGRVALALMGDTIATNLFLLGYACQIGAVPLSVEALRRAIEINGEAVAMNKAAFDWAAAPLSTHRRSPRWWNGAVPVLPLRPKPPKRCAQAISPS
jgi:indolepyruvate ferredoxin oxidoreductase